MSIRFSINFTFIRCGFWVLTSFSDYFIILLILWDYRENVMWLLFALATFGLWGVADLFYKKGNAENEKYTHLKTCVAVGFIMGISAFATLIFKGIDYDPLNLIIYLPVSAMYILSMAVGYFGFKYLELSVASPIQNASGGVSCILLMIILRQLPDTLSLIAVIAVSAGVICLGIFEKKKENDFRLKTDKKYKIGFVAFFMPIIYCVLDSLGTFFDGLYLDSFENTPLKNVTPDNYEDVALVSYEFTFLAVAVVLFIFLRLVKKEKFTLKGQGNRLAAAVFETAGQLTYVYALSGNAVVAVPIISAYCICSAVLARIFLKEKLNKSQYVAVGLVVAGIILMGISEGLAE